MDTLVNTFIACTCIAYVVRLLWLGGLSPTISFYSASWQDLLYPALGLSIAAVLSYHLMRRTLFGLERQIHKLVGEMIAKRDEYTAARWEADDKAVRQLLILAIVLVMLHAWSETPDSLRKFASDILQVDHLVLSLREIESLLPSEVNHLRSLSRTAKKRSLQRITIAGIRQKKIELKDVDPVVQALWVHIQERSLPPEEMKWWDDELAAEDAQ